MEDVEQWALDSHGNHFIALEPQVEARDTVIGDKWTKRNKTSLVEKVSFCHVDDSL